MAQITIHPLWVRVTHWLNALAVMIMLLSGWQIYNASPLFDFKFSRTITLGGWLGGAIAWHFAAMWLLAANGVIYLASGLITGRFRQRLLPLRGQDLWNDLKIALRGQLQHVDIYRYNAVQKALYIFVLCDLILLVMSGLVLWKPVQFPILRSLLGDYDMARYIHFFAMAGVAVFVLIHVVLAFVVPRTLKAMVTGK